MTRPRTRDTETLRVLHVTIVSNNPETRAELQAYFRDAGVGSHATNRIDEAEMAAPSSSALVLFPDDFDPSEALRAIARLSRARPAVLSIIVTRDPRRFEPATRGADGPASVILPKPAWGWTILDAIRAHLDARRAPVD